MIKTKHYLFIILFVFGITSNLFSWDEKLQQRNDNSLGIYPGFIYPAGKLGEMTKPGYGGVISYTHSGIFFRNFICGIESGFYLLEGEATSDKAELEVDRIFIVPLLVTGGYKIPVTGKFFITPSISAGAAYFDATYSPEDEDSTSEEEGDSTFWDMNVKAGIGIIYFFSKSYIGISGDYGMFAETGYLNSYYSGNVLFGYRY